VMWRRNARLRRLGWSSLLGVYVATVSGALVTVAGGAALVASSTVLPDVTALPANPEGGLLAGRVCSGRVCCARSCGRCDDADCVGLPGGMQSCCPSLIAASGVHCGEPPCIVPPKTAGPSPEQVKVRRWAWALKMQEEAVAALPADVFREPSSLSTGTSRVQKTVNDGMLRFVFFVGAEGTGHHLWSHLYKMCARLASRQREGTGTNSFAANSNYAGLCSYDSKLTSLLHANGTSPSSLFFGTRAPLLAAAFVHRLRQIKAQRTSQERLFWLNSGPELLGVGMLSYPNYGTPVENVPNAVLLAHLCEKAGVDLRIIVQLRSTDCAIRSATRRFPHIAINLTHQEQIARASVKQIDHQLERLDPAFFHCSSSSILSQNCGSRFLRNALHPRLPDYFPKCLKKAALRDLCGMRSSVASAEQASDPMVALYRRFCHAHAPEQNSDRHPTRVCVPDEPRLSFFLNRIAKKGNSAEVHYRHLPAAARAWAEACDIVIQLRTPNYLLNNGTLIYHGFQRPAAMRSWPVDRTAVVFSDENCNRMGPSPWTLSERRSAPFLTYPQAGEMTRGKHPPAFVPLHLQSHMKHITKSDAASSERPYLFSMIGTYIQRGMTGEISYSRAEWFENAKSWLKSSCGYVYALSSWRSHATGRAMANDTNLACGEQRGQKGLSFHSPMPLSYAASRMVLLQSIFALQPPGNAFECFRWYEAAAAGSIPIFARTEMNSRFPPCESDVFLGAFDYPFVVVDDIADMEPFMIEHARNQAWLQERQRDVRLWFERMTRRARSITDAKVLHIMGQVKSDVTELDTNVGTSCPLEEPIVGTSASALKELQKSGPRYVVVDVMFGLCNRLRALASAISVAKALNRKVMLVWSLDEHCACEFRQLFAYPESLDFVVEGAIGIENFEMAPDQFQVFNYMLGEKGANKDVFVKADPGRHLVFRSAYLMNHTNGRWRRGAMQELQSLVANPVVERMLVPNDGRVGVHVRQALDVDLLSKEVDPEKLLAWRNRTSWQSFAKPMQQVAASMSSRGARKPYFYVATDSSDVLEPLNRKFPGNIVSITGASEDSSHDRGCNGLQIALADVINLGRTTMILGSMYSSFSEVAQMRVGSGVVPASLHNKLVPRLLAGKEF